MLQAQSVFILGMRYPPPKKNISSSFLVFGPRILHCYKKPVAHLGGWGMHPYRHPQCTETGHLEIQN